VPYTPSKDGIESQFAVVSRLCGMVVLYCVADLLTISESPGPLLLDPVVAGQTAGIRTIAYYQHQLVSSYSW
jgi:hypothetical protein